jgi:hypothetical protein
LLRVEVAEPFFHIQALKLVEEDRLIKFLQTRNLLPEDKKEILRLFRVRKDRAKVHKNKNEKVHFSIPRIEYYYCSFCKTTIPIDIGTDWEEGLDLEGQGYI